MRLSPAHSHSLGPSLASPTCTLASRYVTFNDYLSAGVLPLSFWSDMSWFRLNFATKSHTCTRGRWPVVFCVTPALSACGKGARPLCSSVIMLERVVPFIRPELAAHIVWGAREDWQLLQTDMHTSEETERQRWHTHSLTEPQKDHWLNTSCCCFEGNRPTSCLLSSYLHRGRSIFHVCPIVSDKELHHPALPFDSRHL